MWEGSQSQVENSFEWSKWLDKGKNEDTLEKSFREAAEKLAALDQKTVRLAKEKAKRDKKEAAIKVESTNREATCVIQRSQMAWQD